MNVVLSALVHVLGAQNSFLAQCRSLGHARGHLHARRAHSQSEDRGLFNLVSSDAWSDEDTQKKTVAGAAAVEGCGHAQLLYPLR